MSKTKRIILGIIIAFICGCIFGWIAPEAYDKYSFGVFVVVWAIWYWVQKNKKNE